MRSKKGLAIQNAGATHTQEVTTRVCVCVFEHVSVNVSVPAYTSTHLLFIADRHVQELVKQEQVLL